MKNISTVTFDVYLLFRQGESNANNRNDGDENQRNYENRHAPITASTSWTWTSRDLWWIATATAWVVKSFLIHHLVNGGIFVVHTPNVSNIQNSLNRERARNLNVFFVSSLWLPRKLLFFSSLYASYWVECKRVEKGFEKRFFILT